MKTLKRIYIGILGLLCLPLMALMILLLLPAMVIVGMHLALDLDDDNQLIECCAGVVSELLWIYFVSVPVLIFLTR
jgi:hypothetical protein